MNAAIRRLLETRIVSTAELSALTGVPMITLQKWAERGQVDYVKKGRTYLFDRRDFAEQIEDYEKQNTKKSKDDRKTSKRNFSRI